MKTNREKYKKAFGVLQSSRNYLLEVNKMERTKTRPFMGWATQVAAVVITLLLCTGGAFAAAKLLGPSEIAKEMGNERLKEAFSSEEAVLIDERQSFDDYDIYLLGTVSGKDIADPRAEEREGEFSSDRTYVVIAINRKDGEEVGKGRSFYVSPLFKGVGPEETDASKVLGGYRSYYSDDGAVEYTIVDMDNIKDVAKDKVYIGVQDGGFFNEGKEGEKAYSYDESTGEYSRNEAYRGINALFELPL